MFDDKKIPQLIAFFLSKQKGRMPVLKLIKLLYLADRESMARFGVPITFDGMAALPNGPILSITLDYINGFIDPRPQGWDELIEPRDGYDISLRKPITRDDLDRVSDANLEVMESVWNKFGWMDKWQIRDYTHDQCPEWEDPGRSSKPISPKKVFLALGCSEQEAKALEDDIKMYEEVNARLS